MVITSSALTISMGRSCVLVARQLLADGGFDPHQKNAHPEFARGSNRAFDLGSRGMVAPHGIQSYCDHRLIT